MQKREQGRSGLMVSVLTFGGWQAGGTSWTDTSDEASLAAIKAAHEVGINFFDTAEGYGGGHSERILGKALQGVAGEALIATKVGPEHLAHDKLVASCEASLKNLQREVIDLYQVHWPAGTWNPPQTPIEETMATLNELQKAGKIRAIGLSNFNAEQIAEAARYGTISALQPPYSLFYTPYVENGTIEYCRSHDIAVIAYSPLAQGLLTGKFDHSNRPTDNRAGNALFQEPAYTRAIEALAQLKPLAQKYQRTTGDLALQWLLAQPGLTSAIVGARTEEQVRENVKASDFTISPEDLKTIDEIAAPVRAALPPGKTNPWG
jgi:aryl-alcohol dehydrogenase-like predicted oxidoreductase